jgi:hypothetical protein
VLISLKYEDQEVWRDNEARRYEIQASSRKKSNNLQGVFFPNPFHGN